jgi:hypothetical protein
MARVKAASQPRNQDRWLRWRDALEDGMARDYPECAFVVVDTETWRG